MYSAQVHQLICWSVAYWYVYSDVTNVAWDLQTVIVYYREKEEVGRLKETHNEEEFFTNLPREFRVMLTHIKSLSYFDTPDYELLSNVFLQAMNRLGEFILLS